ncbi:MAG: GatB/YqeY domain-containing protein [Campylobacterales bacterium]|nr:GatB/YqeY domain-containing protein [Campylobacterales bacterium]
MSLKAQIQSDIKDAMRAKEVLKRDTLRSLSAEIKQVEVDERIEVNDERTIALIQKMIKKRNDSITEYKKGNREDLAEKEQGEIDILSEYMPKQLSDEELEAKVKEIIEKTGATSGKDMGKIMGMSAKEIGALADNKRISQMAKKLLG